MAGRSFLISALIVASISSTAGFSVGQSGARPFLSPLFGSNMVVQRGIRAPVWGWTKPGARVVVSILGKAESALADADGKWVVKLPPLSAGGPYKLTVTGPEQVTLENVLIGDVWICSGQSNMEMGISQVKDAEQEIAQAEHPQIRLFTVAKTIALEPNLGFPVRSSDLSGIWSVCTPQTVKTGGWGGYSAAAYFFGRKLQQELNVPIGLIHTSWGGTVAEAWTSAEALKTMRDFGPAVAQLDEMRADFARGSDNFDNRMAEWWAKNDPGSAGGLGWADPVFDASAWKSMSLPTRWEDAGLPNFDGVVWFRKEVDLPSGAAEKAGMLRLGPIDDRDTTWVNGVKVGALDDWQTAREYKIPAGVLKAGRNVIAVRVLDTGGAGGIYGNPEQMALEVEGRSAFALAGAWRFKDSIPLSRTSPAPQHVTNNPNLPTVLYNGMISPLLPFGIKGAIWYQGESNASRAYQYRTLLPTMIRDWRNRWGEGDFPFYIVQLANFQAANAEPVDDSWAELREAQSLTVKSVPNTGLAVTIDIGEANDIHPKNKQEVGNRLALAALATTYGKKIAYSGPTYRAMKTEGNSIRVIFDHASNGLSARGGDLKGFAIAGEDRHFVWADARIEGQTIVISSPKVANPVAVRYAWSVNPVCNLYNGAGLPASPFRTDTWEGVTANNR